MPNPNAAKPFFAFCFLLILGLFSGCPDEFPDPVDPDEDIVFPIQTACKRSDYGEQPEYSKGLSFEACFVPNEIISNTTGFDDADRAKVYQHLQSKGYEQVDACDCEVDLVLWRNESDTDPDPVGVIAEAPEEEPDPVGDTTGLSLNYIVAFPNQEGDKISDDTIEETLKESIVSPDPDARQIIVGIVDVGTFRHDNLANRQQLQPVKYCGGDSLDHNLGLDMFVPKDSNVQDHFGHGTLVNGVSVGASIPVHNRGAQRANIQLLNAKISQADTRRISLFKAVCGLHYVAKRGANVINISWGFLSPRVPGIFGSFLRYANDKNIVITAAVGNDSLHLDGSTRFWPAAFNHYPYTPGNNTVIAVGAYDIAGGKLSDFSNYGDPIIDIAALGTKVIGITNDQLPAAQQSSGTSYATPYVTRTVAIIQAMNPGLKPFEIKECLLRTADPMDTGHSAYPEVPLLDHNEAVSTCGTSPLVNEN